MKRATIHLTCDGDPADIEIHDDGEVVMPPGFDFEAELAAVELGFEPSECLAAFLGLRSGFYQFLKKHRLFPEVYSKGSLILHLSDQHMTRKDRRVFEEELRAGTDSIFGMHALAIEGGFQLYMYDSPLENIEIVEGYQDGELSEGLVNALQAAWDLGFSEVFIDAGGWEFS